MRISCLSFRFSFIQFQYRTKSMQLIKVLNKVMVIHAEIVTRLNVTQAGTRADLEEIGSCFWSTYVFELNFVPKNYWNC